MSREKQLVNNLNDILGGYENGMYDDYYPQMTLDECISYCVPEIYHIKADGRGTTFYADNICEDLKFLGADYINSKIKEIAQECGILKA